MKHTLLWRGLLVTLTVIILYLALTPAPPTTGSGWDKANHAAAMAAVTIAAYGALLPLTRAALYAGLYAMMLGIVLELLQASCTATRSAEWGDLGADAVGTALALVLVLMWQRRKGGI